MSPVLTALLILLAGDALPVAQGDLARGPADEPRAARAVPASKRQIGSEIKGVLHDRDGHVLADVFLVALPSGRTMKSFHGVGRSQGSPLLRRHDLPRTMSIACTDSEGVFHLTKLLPGVYDIFLQARAGDSWRTYVSARAVRAPLAAAVVTDGTCVELVADVDLALAQRWNFDRTDVVGALMGRLSVTVRSPDGRPYDLDNQVGVVRLPGRVAVRHTRRYNNSPWYQTDLAPGRYAVSVSAEDSVPSCLVGAPLGLARFGPTEQEFEIRDGQTVELTLRLVRGGRVRVALPMPGPALDPLLQRALAVPEPMGGNEFLAALEGASAGTARLVDLNERVIELTFFSPRLCVLYRFPAILPGTNCLSYTIIPPGVYRLEVSLPGYVETASEVVIRTDEITDVRLPLAEKH